MMVQSQFGLMPLVLLAYYILFMANLAAVGASGSYFGKNPLSEMLIESIEDDVPDRSFEERNAWAPGTRARVIRETASGGFSWLRFLKRAKNFEPIFKEGAAVSIVYEVDTDHVCVEDDYHRATIRKDQLEVSLWTKELNYQTLYLAVCRTFADKRFLRRPAVRKLKLIQSDSCKGISCAIQELCEQEPQFKRDIGNLKAVLISYGGCFDQKFHVSLRNEDTGATLDFQGFMAEQDFVLADKKDRKLMIPRLTPNGNFIVKEGYHCYFVDYLVNEKSWALKLSDKTLELIDEDLMNPMWKHPIEERLMDDRLVCAIIASPKSWKAVKRETGLEFSYILPGVVKGVRAHAISDSEVLKLGWPVRVEHVDGDRVEGRICQGHGDYNVIHKNIKKSNLECEVDCSKSMRNYTNVIKFFVRKHYTALKRLSVKEVKKIIAEYEETLNSEIQSRNAYAFAAESSNKSEEEEKVNTSAL